MMLLAFDCMLDDLVRFCTVTWNLSVLSVPNLHFGWLWCNHDNILPSAAEVWRQAPIEDLFHFFATSLVGKRELLHLKCFGSDREAALVNEFFSCFSWCLAFTLFLHFRGNIDRKLQELKIPPEVSREFVKDIFGCPSKLEKGLVDSKDEAELQSAIAGFEKAWNEKEKKYSCPLEFHSWFYEMLCAVSCSILCVKELG